jgi:hypothetical protein
MKNQKAKRKSRNKRRRARKQAQKESQQPKKLSKGQQARKLLNAMKQKRKYQPGGADYIRMMSEKA